MKKQKSIIRTLTSRSFKSNKTRNLVAILAIVLTTLMFTSLFVLSQSMVKNLQDMNFQQAGHDSHLSSSTLTDEEMEKIVTHEAVRDFGKSIVIGIAENEELTGRQIEIRTYRPLNHEKEFYGILKAYDEDSGYGLLRHVLVRVGHMTGEIMVVLVLGSPILPSKKNFVNHLCKLHPEITTILINVNNKRTSMVLGEKEQVIYGKGYIEDELCGRRFKISAKSFYQVNSVQTEALYAKAAEYAQLTGKEMVVDAYCGIGTIALAVAGQAGKVIGVELNKDAVRDAVTNAKINQIKNADFYQNDAGHFLTQMADAGEKVDVVFMDPPRSGSTEEFLDALIRICPKRIVYISCEPETLARDLKYLTGKSSYRVQEITPVDMFPFTGNIETVCLLGN